MKKLVLSFAFVLATLAAICTARVAEAARPNPPMIAGTVPVALFVTPPGGTNAVPVPPRVHVIDERGRIIADLETTLDGVLGTFEIPLKKAGTYAIWAYYPEPNQRQTSPQLVDVLRKQTATANLTWPGL